MKKLDKINRQMIHAEFIKIMREEKLKQGHLRQKVTDVLLTMNDVWEEGLEENKNLIFFGNLSDNVTYEGRWSRGHVEGDEQVHVVLKAVSHPHESSVIGQIDVVHGFLRTEPQEHVQAKPRVKLADSAEITVTSPNWDYSDGMKSELAEEKIRVRHAVGETAITVVDDIYRAIARSQEKVNAGKKISKFNLMTKSQGGEHNLPTQSRAI